MVTGWLGAPLGATYVAACRNPPTPSCDATSPPTSTIASHRFNLRPGVPELGRLRDACLEPWTDEPDRAALHRPAVPATRVAKVGRSWSWQSSLQGGLP